MLKFLGIGSAFNTIKGNNCAFINYEKRLILVDCGSMVFHRLKKNEMFDGVEEFEIIITHTHPDHIGSLGDVIFYAYFILKIIPKIYFPEKELLLTYLECIGVESKMYELHCGEKLEGRDFTIEYLPVPHVGVIPAYGFFLNHNGKDFYYSGDSNIVPEIVLEKLEKGEIEKAYQDTSGLEYEGNVHLPFSLLCETVPEPLRSKFFIMHHDDALDIDKVRAEGFSVAKLCTDQKNCNGK